MCMANKELRMQFKDIVRQEDESDEAPITFTCITNVGRLLNELRIKVP